MINISYQTHPHLYLDIEKCVEYCKTIPTTEEIKEKPVLFHFYWNIGMPFERKQILVLKSYLATQNLENTKAIYWCNKDITNNPFLKPFLPYIEFRIYDVEKEIKNTILDGRRDIIRAVDNKNYLQGDLFRILVLYKYGGIYFDIDSVILRDFSPLLNQEFMYTWSYLIEQINGAVMRLFKGSKLGSDLLENIALTPPMANSTCWSCDTYVNVRKKNNNWTVFPCAFFNPEWQYTKREIEKYSDPNDIKELKEHIRTPFNKNKYSNELYDGTFSWHWHNQWNANVQDGSKWHIIEQNVNRRLYERLGIGG